MPAKEWARNPGSQALRRTISTVTITGTAGSVLRQRRHRSSPAGSQTHARIAEDVAQLGARRIGMLAVLTAVTVLGSAIALHALQPEISFAEQSPLYHLSALFLVLSGLGIAVLQRFELVSPQAVLDVGLIFQIAGAGALALTESAAPWQDGPIRGASAAGVWMAICVMVIPNRPWKSITAAALSAAIVPCAHLAAARIVGYPPLPWNRLICYSLAPLLVFGWTPLISIRLHRLHEDLSRSREFGGYHLEKLLGRGGMGEVWLARHRLLRREAAVKFVLAGLLEHAGHAERKQIQRRFESEARAIASLRSPHTVAIYDYGLAENGSLYYAMEYLHGLDAEELVERYGPQPPGRVVYFLRQACESLEEAHAAGLVHRDIKPGNLFICRLGKRTDFVKVLDFGLVKEQTTATGTALTDDGSRTGGTPAYMAPEQVRGEEVDRCTDIYGLGCVAYFLLTGSVVFDKPSAMAMAVAHLTDPPEPPSLRSEMPIPQSLEQIVMACLEKQRERRPQSVVELGAMLDNCAGVKPWTAADASRWWALHKPEQAAVGS